VQAQFNAWAGETGLAYVQLWRTCAISIGENYSNETLARFVGGESERLPQLLQSAVLWHMFLAYAMEATMPEQRHVKLFRNGRNQAVRIPEEFELAGNEAIMHRDGDRLVIEPVRKRGLIALLKSMKPLEEAFPEFDDSAPAD